MIEILYFKYFILLIFKNTINDLVYISDILYINKIYKKLNIKYDLFFNK